MNTDQILQALVSIAQAMNKQAQVMQTAFPQVAGTSTTASAGTGGAPPAQVDKYMVVTLTDGSSRKVPLYL